MRKTITLTYRKTITHVIIIPDIAATVARFELFTRTVLEATSAP
jgi:hypothetical protein